MKKLMLLGILGLVVAGGMNEAGATSCCSGSKMGADLTAGNPSAMPDPPDCIRGHQMMASQRGMAGHEGTVNHCDPSKPVTSGSTTGFSGSHEHGIAHEAQSHIEQKDGTMPGE